MQDLEIGGWTIQYHPEQTRTAYAATDRVTHQCRCLHCRNFLAVRDQHCPAEFVDLLNNLCVPTHREAEVYEIGPGPGGTRVYGGWYHFVGFVIADPGGEVTLRGPGGEWSLYFTPARDLALETFANLPVVQLEFRAEVPWVLNEPVES